MPHDNLPDVSGPLYTVIINVTHDGQPVQPQLSFAAPAEMLKDNLLGVWRALDALLPMSAKAGASGAPVDELPPLSRHARVQIMWDNYHSAYVEREDQLRAANATIAQLRARVQELEDQHA